MQKTISWGKPLTREQLTPCQRDAFDELCVLTRMGEVAAVCGEEGAGRSTILRTFAGLGGGRYVSAGDLMPVFRRSPATERHLDILRYLFDLFEDYDLLALDDWDVLCGQLGNDDGATRTLLQECLYRQAERSGKTLVLGAGLVPDGRRTRDLFLRNAMATALIEQRGADDYRVICENLLGAEQAAAIDFDRIFAFASALSCHDLKVACGIVQQRGLAGTDGFLDALAMFMTISNTRNHEVEDIRFETMPGTEHIARALETHIVLPMTNMELAERLDLKAKRGVLLHGPPGTGKTSVGRALARRMQGRFFLIDGSVGTEPAYAFLAKVQGIVRQAIDNAPSVLFIDDADVLFGIPHVAGFARYLLSLLDGLAGENASKLCVMMTAMDASKVPQAIIRSGRVELWLETRPPAAPVRAAIIDRWMSEKLPRSDSLDHERLGEATAGFTPADLRRVANDAKSYYAQDIDAERPLLDATAYALKAIDSVVATRRAMALNLADPSLRV